MPSGSEPTRRSQLPLPLAVAVAQQVGENVRLSGRPAIVEEDPLIVVRDLQFDRHGQLGGNPDIARRVVVHHAVLCVNNDSSIAAAKQTARTSIAVWRRSMLNLLAASRGSSCCCRTVDRAGLRHP